ncbi:hypothetical protein Droror1_Dr00001557 [Drosera rotundifolia]
MSILSSAATQNTSVAVISPTISHDQTTNQYINQQQSPNFSSHAAQLLTSSKRTPPFLMNVMNKDVVIVVISVTRHRLQHQRFSLHQECTTSSTLRSPSIPRHHTNTTVTHHSNQLLNPSGVIFEMNSTLEPWKFPAANPIHPHSVTVLEFGFTSNIGHELVL